MLHNRLPNHMPKLVNHVTPIVLQELLETKRISISWAPYSLEKKNICIPSDQLKKTDQPTQQPMENLVYR